MNSKDACEILITEDSKDDFNDQNSGNGSTYCNSMRQIFLTPRLGDEENKAVENRHSPEKEFFSLSCLALKIKMAEQDKKHNN